MRKVMKKIVASLATVAMAAGLFATMPAQETKAATTKEVVFVLSDMTDVGEVLIQVNSNVAECSATEKKIPGWGESDFGYVTTKEGDCKFKLTLSVTDTVSKEPDNYCSLKVVVLKKDGSAVLKGQNFYAQNFAEKYNAADKVYVSIDMSKDAWKDDAAISDITTKDPTKVDASGVIAKIDEIGTVELKEESLSKINAAETAYNNFIKNGGDAADVTNYSKLTAAKTKYAELQAAEDAKFAGKLTVYVNVKATGWNKVCLYSWDRDNTKYFGDWPGNELTALKKNVGWYSCSFDITREARVIFNNGEGGGSNQTVDWTGVKAGTYWITLSEKESDGKFKVDKVSTKAPSDWKDEAAQEVETQAKPAETTTAAPATTDKGDVVSKDEAAKFEKEAVVEGQPEGAALKVTEIAADSDVFKAVKEVAKTDLKNRTYVAVDFKLLKGTEAVQPNGDVKITMPVPEKLKNAKQVEVFRMGDDGKLVNLGKADVTDSKITFTTNHFSTYVFAEVKTATGTGDVAPIIALLAVAAVAGAMVVASRKKTVNE